MSKMSEFDVITNPAGFYVPLFTPESGGLNRRGLLQKLGLPWVLAQSGVAASPGAVTSEVTLATIVAPAGCMGANGLIRVQTLWSMTNSANNKVPRVKFGGTTLLDVTLTTVAVLSDQRIVQNRNSQSSQIAKPLGNMTGGGWGTATSAVVTASVDTSADTTILITGQKSSAGETLTLESYLVEVMYKE